MNFPGFTAERSLQLRNSLSNISGANLAARQSDQVEPAFLGCITACLISCYKAGGSSPNCAETCAYACRKFHGLAIQPQFSE